MGERFPKRDKNFACSFFNCKATFTKYWKLEAHLCKHTGLRPFACQSCDKSFSTRYQLTRHHLTHSGEKPYLCSEEGCPQKFISSAGMKKHVARVHQQKEQQYVCDVEGCGKQFCKKNKMKAHKCEHTKLFPFACSFQGCSQKFADSKLLRKHGKVHDGYPCAAEGCSFKGNTWSGYQKHRKQEHRVVLPCDGCKRVFSQAWFLLRHRQRVHLGQKRPMLHCTVQGCQKGFTTRFNLQSHVLSFHEGKRAFKCPHPGCKKAFAMKESLKRHRVAHDPEKRKIKPKRGEAKQAPKPPKKAGGSEAVSDASKIAASLQNLKFGVKPQPTDQAKVKPQPTDQAKVRPKPPEQAKVKSQR